MPRLRTSLSSLLIGGLLIFSFNAYACVLPLAASPSSTMADCPQDGTEPARTFCDAFTVVGPLASEDGSWSGNFMTAATVARDSGGLPTLAPWPQPFSAVVLPNLLPFHAPVILRA